MHQSKPKWQQADSKNHYKNSRHLKRHQAKRHQTEGQLAERHHAKRHHAEIRNHT